MKAGEQTLQGTLTEQKQYVVPIFQRYYSWRSQQWQQLWDDICELREAAKPGKRHFMGALVFVLEKAYSYSIPVYQVIDGQQRMLTLTLLLSALRNCAENNGYASLAAEITETVLIHKHKKDRERFRIYPRQRDRDKFMASVLSNVRVDGPIGDAIRFFEERITEDIGCAEETKLDEFYAFVIGGLEFVHINLSGENPYKIFRSLNSTGVDLSEADLIRNFVFMHVPLDDQDEFDASLWSPIEARFVVGQEVDSKKISAFFRDFLMMNAASYIRPNEIFEEFESRFDDEFNPVELAHELLKASALYDVVRGKECHDSKQVNDALMKLRELDTATTNPLLLKLLLKLKLGEISEEQVVDCIESLCGFIFRRYICREQSRAYGRWFVTVCSEINGEAPRKLEEFLMSKGFPTAPRFRSELARFPLYGSPYCGAVLHQLERSYGHNEMPDPNAAQIEHVLPQTLSDEWIEDLGPEAERIHQEWVDRLGNLTLTGYNQGLSNNRFSTKLVGSGITLGYKDSNFELTKQIAKLDSWGERELMQRGEVLARRAAEIWIGPESDPDEEQETNSDSSTTATLYISNPAVATRPGTFANAMQELASTPISLAVIITQLQAKQASDGQLVPSSTNDSNKVIGIRARYFAARVLMPAQNPQSGGNGNPYKDGSVIRGLYDCLADGQWHLMSELEATAAGKVNFPGRIRRLVRRGKNWGLWEIERVADRIRMIHTTEGISYKADGAAG